METVLWILKLVSAFVWFAPFLEFSLLVVMLYAMSRVRIISTNDEVYVDGVDPWTTIAFAAVGLVVSSVLFVFLGAGAACFAAALSLLAALGCRIELWVTNQGSRFTRRIFGVLPWSVWHSESAATLFIDGWGDMMDPEALHVDFGLRSLELAWGGAKSGERADELVSEFNAAVRAMRLTRTSARAHLMS